MSPAATGPAGRWPDRRLLDLFGTAVPIVQAPMAGASSPAMAAAVADAGGLGSLGFALAPAERVRAGLEDVRRRTSRPVAANFFCGGPPVVDAARAAAWARRLQPYRRELGLDPLAGAPAEPPAAVDPFFGPEQCRVLTDLAPRVVSFHFGLPGEELLRAVKDTGAAVVSTATTVAEAVWLEQRGCDAVVAQGTEAGGHRGSFLAGSTATQAGTLALVPQVVDAVGVPVIAAGGIADGRGIAAALALGAAGVQVGTAYLSCPEADLAPAHRRALRTVREDGTAITDVFTGRPARAVVTRAVRELGPVAGDLPDFPLPMGALAPLRAAAEARGSDDFTALWCGQSAALARELPAAQLTALLAREALERLAALQPTAR